MSGLLLIVRSDRDEIYSSATSFDFVDAISRNDETCVIFKLITRTETCNIKRIIFRKKGKNKGQFVISKAYIKI